MKNLHMCAHSFSNPCRSFTVSFRTKYNGLVIQTRLWHNIEINKRRCTYIPLLILYHLPLLVTFPGRKFWINWIAPTLGIGLFERKIILFTVILN